MTDATTTFFTWHGKELRTSGDLMDAMSTITDPDEAIRFREGYRATNEHADVNLGYLTGYFDAVEASRLRELFDVDHPVFGRTTPTPGEAFRAGQRLMKEYLDEQ